MRILSVLLPCLCLLATPLLAETYSWTDSSGTVNFTDDYYSVPPKYRGQVKKLGDLDGNPSASQVPDAATIDKKAPDKPKNRPVATGNDAKASATADTKFGGRTFDEWQRDFDQQEGELKTLDAKAKEAEAERKQFTRSGGYSQLQLQRMYDRHNAAVDSYNKAVERYNLLLESAKKAGVPFKPRK